MGTRPVLNVPPLSSAVWPCARASRCTRLWTQAELHGWWCRQRHFPLSLIRALSLLVRFEAVCGPPVLITPWPPSEARVRHWLGQYLKCSRPEWNTWILLCSKQCLMYSNGAGTFSHAGEIIWSRARGYSNQNKKANVAFQFWAFLLDLQALMPARYSRPTLGILSTDSPSFLNSFSLF